MNIPEFKVTKEHLDDPRWNSGFDEYTFKFEDGIIFCSYEMPSAEVIKNFYISSKFSKWWKENEQLLRSKYLKRFKRNYLNNKS